MIVRSIDCSTKHVVEKLKLALRCLRFALFELTTKRVGALHHGFLDALEEFRKYLMREFPEYDLAGKRYMKFRLSEKPFIA